MTCTLQNDKTIMTTEWTLVGLNIAFHQIAKLTIYAIEEGDLSQADRLYSVYFATHLYNL